MSLRIQSIHLRNFRKYEKFQLGGIGRLTIFVGPNAVGKTSVLEGIQLLSALNTFRNCDMSEIVKQGADEAYASACVADENRQLEITLNIVDKKRSYKLNNKPKRIHDLRGLVPAVSFSPDDLALVKGASSARRRALDMLGIQLNANYHQIYQDYQKIHRHKSKLLKEEASPDLLAAVNETFVQVSAQMTAYRRRLFDRILPLIQRLYLEIADGVIGSEDGEGADGSTGSEDGEGADGSTGNEDGEGADGSTGNEETNANTSGTTEQISGIYAASWEDSRNGSSTGAEEDRIANEEPENLSSAVESRLGEEIAKERILEGAHLDKISFYINGLDVQKFASQGQQRSVVLAWKLAEVELIKELLGQTPILLLDDVMSELDKPRRNALMNYLSNDLQVFITTTNADYFEPEMLKEANIVNLPLSENQIS